MLKNKFLLLAALCFVGVSFCADEREDLSRFQRLQTVVFSVPKSPVVKAAVPMAVGYGMYKFLNAGSYDLSEGNAKLAEKAFNVAQSVAQLPEKLISFVPFTKTLLAKAADLGVASIAVGTAVGLSASGSVTDVTKISCFLGSCIGVLGAKVSNLQR